jgi:threonine dehydrogenase-like Zn-dependent dehydrogenase
LNSAVQSSNAECAARVPFRHFLEDDNIRRVKGEYRLNPFQTACILVCATDVVHGPINRCEPSLEKHKSEAACLQSLSDSVAAVETAGIRLGDSVAIFGQGSMGLECMQIARVSGAGRIIAVDVREEACAMAGELGADYVINAARSDAVETIRSLSGGNGADVVFECAGGSPKQGLAGTRTLMQAIDAVRSGGTLVGVSWFGGSLEFPIDTLRERSLRYVFPDISTLDHLEHTVRLVSTGRVRLKPAITHVLSGIEKVPEAFEITANKGKYKAINPAQVMMGR